VPESYAVGSIKQFTWDSAWWVFNFVANFATLKYSYMIEDIRAVQRRLEGDLIALQPAVDQTPDLMTRYLTDYSVTHGNLVVKRWRELAEYLMRKYNDGYVQDENASPREVGYPEEWLREVLKSRPEQFKLPEKKPDVPESQLVD